MAKDTNTARSDALRGVHYQFGRCEDAIDLAHMALSSAGVIEPEWSLEFRLDIEVLRSKLTTITSLLSTEPRQAGPGQPVGG